MLNKSLYPDKGIILISLILAILFSSLILIRSDENNKIDLEKNLSQIKKEKDNAAQLHFKGNFMESINLYESILLKLQSLENINKEKINNSQKSDILKLKKEFNNYIANEGFYSSENFESNTDLKFPEKIDKILGIAWLSQNDVKVAIACKGNSNIGVDLILGYGWKDNDGTFGVEPISSLELILEPSTLNEVTFIGIPKNLEDKDIYKIYTNPGIFVILSDSKKDTQKIEKIEIQGIYNNYINFSHHNQYYFRSLSMFTFIANSIRGSNNTTEEYRLYLKKKANLFFNPAEIELKLSDLEEKKQNLMLKTGWVVKDFPTEIALDIPPISKIDLLSFDNMILEVINKENENLKYLILPGLSFFLLDKTLNIKLTEQNISNENSYEFLLEDSTDNKIKNLITKLKFNYWNISQNAQIELIKAGKDAIPYLLKEIEANSKFSKQIFEIIGKIGDIGIPILIEFTNKKTEEIDLQFFEELARCYSFIGSSAINPLVDILKQKSISKTIFVCMALAEINDRTSGKYLVNTMKDINNGSFFTSAVENENTFAAQEKYLKSVVIHTLGILKEKQVVPLLITAIQNDPSEKVLDEISFALGQIQDSTSIDSLIFLAELGHKRAFEGLYEMKVKKSIPIFLKDFNSYSSENQLIIVNMCKEMGDIKLLSRLIELSNNDKVEMKVRANLDLAVEQIVGR